MPTTRRRRLRPSVRLTLDSFTYGELSSFVRQWWPPMFFVERESTRWATWDDYFAEFDSIADELTADPIWSAFGEPFAARVRREMAAKRDRIFDAHQHRALLHAHFYKRGDQHQHSDASTARLGPAIEVRATLSAVTKMEAR